MKVSLYEIQNEFLKITEALLENGGEVSEEMEAALQINKESLENKAVNYGFVCKQLEAENKMIDQEIERLSQLKSARNKIQAKLKTNLTLAMQLFDVDKIESPLIKLSFRKSQSTEIDDLELIDKKFMVEKTTVSPDKKAIKEAIEAGEIVTGARIQNNFNLQIK